MQSIKFKKLETILLAIIVVFAALLFTHKLGSNPPGLYLDEVGTGYNTYSILKTGKDEYGKSFPLAFRLFGSYTPPLYIYLSVPIMAIMGMSVVSTRMLSVISGLFAIIVIFLIIKELKIAKSKFTPLVATLFFAITPWLIFYSRIGYEQNLAFLFFSISTLLVAKTVKNPKLAMLTIPFISLSTYTDYPQRIVAPLLLLGMFILFWKKLHVKKNIKYLIFGICAAAIIQIPNLYFMSTPSFYTKTEHFYSDVILIQAKKIEHFIPSAVAIPLAFVREFSSQFFAYLSPRSLFFLPDEDLQRSIPEMSVFYFWMVAPYIVGLFYLYKNRASESVKLIILLLMIAPLPGALTRQAFHIQRTLCLLLPVTLIIAAGIDRLINKLSVRLWFPIGTVVFLFSLLLFWRSYFVLLPQERSTVWAYQFAPLAEYISSHPDETFIIDQSSRVKPQDMAYTQLAFYLKLDPKILQADQVPNIVKNYYSDTTFSFIHKFANVETKPIDWKEVLSRDVIIVGDSLAISSTQIEIHNLSKVFEIIDPNGELVLQGYKTNLNKE